MNGKNKKQSWCHEKINRNYVLTKKEEKEKKRNEVV